MNKADGCQQPCDDDRAEVSFDTAPQSKGRYSKCARTTWFDCNDFGNACWQRRGSGRSSGHEVAHRPYMLWIRCHWTSLLPSNCGSARQCSDKPRDFDPCPLEACSSTRYRSVGGARNTMWDPGNQNCTNTSSRNCIHCLYEASHGAGNTKCSKREYVTSESVIAKFYRTRCAYDKARHLLHKGVLFHHGWRTKRSGVVPYQYSYMTRLAGKKSMVLP